MADFIYDKGACVARIVNGEVFSETTKRLVAAIREGKVYALNGEFLVVPPILTSSPTVASTMLQPAAPFPVC